jgi:hypothetical protein
VSRSVAVAGLLAVALACNRDVRPQPVAGPAKEATLVFTSELKGYLAPCGCSENMRGGIDRAAFQLAQLRKTRPVLLLDTGDALFGTKAIADEAVAQQERKAKAVAQALTAMGLAATAPGPLDDARGPAFRAGLGLPELGADATLTLDVGGFPVVVARSAKLATLATLAARARAAKASVIIGLFEGPYDEALKAGIDELELDLLIATRGRDEWSTEENRLAMLKTPVVQVQSKGRSLLRVDLHLRDATKVQWLKSPSETQRELEALAQRVELLRAQVNDPSMNAELRALKQAKLDEVVARREALAAEEVPAPPAGNAASVRFVPLEASFEKLPEVTAVVTAYDRDVGELNLAWAKEHGAECEAPEPGKPSYTGSGVCIGCHLAAWQVWQGTKHPHGYESLVSQGKQHHLDCVACHVTGWKERGGVCRIDQVEGKTEVGCEACHGPGSGHVSVPVKATIVRPTTAQACTGCHDRENSPHFDFEKYLPRILGPGHGVPMPDAGVPEVVDAGVADAGVRPAKPPRRK